MKKEHIYITTPIFYVNSIPHLGHGSTLVIGDFLSRAYKEILDYDVFFLTGTDEHGEKVAKKAEENHLSPENFVEKIAQSFKDLCSTLNINYHRFIRTTDKDHIESVTYIWNYLLKKSLIYKDKYSGFYCAKEEKFISNKDLTDDQKFTKEGDPVYFLEEECYFLKLNAFKKEIDEFLNSNPTIPKNRVNELKGFIKDEIKDLCISREGKSWGIPVPNDENSTIYVWLDALTNYLTACGYPKNLERWNNVIHILGKDILMFHGIYWPIILKAADIKEMPRLLVHNWWIFKDSKMSKSLGNVIDPFEICKKFSSDVLRFYILKEPLFSTDRNFSEEEMINDFNSLIVNKFSNLIYRTFSLMEKKNILFNKTKNEFPREKILKDHIKNFEIAKYIEEVLLWCDELNEEFDKKTMWKNIDLLPEISEKIHSLSKYFIPIFPQVKKWYENPCAKIIFSRISIEVKNI